MKSNTEGWSNQQLNDRIEELENRLEAIKMVCDALSFKYDFIEDIKEILEADVDSTS